MYLWDDVAVVARTRDAGWSVQAHCDRLLCIGGTWVCLEMRSGKRHVLGLALDDEDAASLADLIRRQRDALEESVQ